MLIAGSSPLLGSRVFDRADSSPLIGLGCLVGFPPLGKTLIHHGLELGHWSKLGEPRSLLLKDSELRFFVGVILSPGGHPLKGASSLRPYFA